MITSIDKLIVKINEQFDKGIDHLYDLYDILIQYKGDDFKIYKKFCNKTYTRNLVYRNKNFEIFILCWSEEQESGAHDHPSNGCILKVLEGELIEKSYRLDKNGNLKWKEIQGLHEGEISYQEGSNGIHNIINPNSDRGSVTLHIYSPPNYKPNFFENF